MKPKFIDYFMDIAERTAQLSYAKRLQVGAVIVKGNQILASGYNGMPSGWENNCETKEWMALENPDFYTEEEIEQNWPYVAHSDDPVGSNDSGYIGRYRLKSKPEVLHAEMNALMRLAASTESSIGSTLFITHSPCLECAKAIYQSGIGTVYYKHDYRSVEGVEFLKKTGVNIKKIDDGDK